MIMNELDELITLGSEPGMHRKMHWKKKYVKICKCTSEIGSCVYWFELRHGSLSSTGEC